MIKKNLLKIKHLSISFTQYERGLRQKEFFVIKDLNMEIKEREIVAVVGASGSGKSLLAHAILGILPYNAKAEGEIYYKNQKMMQEQKEKLRGNKMVLIPQNVSYLDPLMKVGKQIEKGNKERKEKSLQLLKRYELEEDVKNKYPFELSGGMIRRVLIAAAMAEEAEIVIADEPTPGISKKAVQNIVEDFKELAEKGSGVLFITHDLEVAIEAADRILVLYAGNVIEEARKEDFQNINSLRHPYTKALYRAMPKNGFYIAKGSQPYEEERKNGCPYAGNCEEKEERCEQKIPYQAVKNGWVRCIHIEK